MLVRMYGCRAPFAVTILDMTSNGTPRGNNAVTIAVIIASTFVTVAVLGGAVALSLAGRELTTIVGLIGPTAAAAAVMIAALGKLVSLDRKTDEQTEKIDQVAHQTNGALKEHIRATIKQELRAALTEQFGPPTDPTKRRR